MCVCVQIRKESLVGALDAASTTFQPDTISGLVRLASPFSSATQFAMRVLSSAPVTVMSVSH